MSWVGFTDDELKRLRQEYGNTEKELENKPTAKTADLKRSALNPAAGKRHRPREKLRTRNKENLEARTSREDGAETRRMPKVRSTQMLPSKAGHDEERENSSPESDKSELPEQKKGNTPSKQGMSSPVSENPEESSRHESGSGAIAQSEIVIIDEPERIKAIELSALEKMQQKQKEMEEENKKKAAALQETIRKRYKKTQAETQTLAMAQKELSHLDSLLSADVKILRDQIDQACQDYHYAQKRYEKAETEFIAAKINLHQKTERKELLTEHLYTVIQANEQRKAKKLETLMAKLNLSEDSLEKEQVEEQQTRTEEMNKTVLGQSESVSGISGVTVPEEKPLDSSTKDKMPSEVGKSTPQPANLPSESTKTPEVSNAYSHNAVVSSPPQLEKGSGSGC